MAHGIGKKEIQAGNYAKAGAKKALKHGGVRS